MDGGGIIGFALIGLIAFFVIRWARDGVHDPAFGLLENNWERYEIWRRHDNGQEYLHKGHHMLSIAREIARSTLSELPYVKETWVVDRKTGRVVYKRT